MKKETSLYLDAVRFLAAAFVFIDHASSGRYTGGLLWQLAPLGPQAVMVFFVLSGFVITYVTETKEQSLRSYTISRASRIYSVALPALILTFVLDEIARNIKPFLFNSSWGYEWTGRLSQFSHALVFLNQTWYNNINIGSNLPYWSLGYEVWYYVLFSIALFSSGLRKVLLLLLVLLFIGPKIVALFPIWLLGFLAYRICSRSKLSANLGLFLFVTSTVCLVLYELYVIRYGIPKLYNNFLKVRLLYQDYIIGILFFIQVIGFNFSASFFSRILVFFKHPIRWLAGATFSLYLFHMPLCQFLSALSLWAANSWESRVMIYFGVPLIVFMLAHYTERKKHLWRRGIETGFDLSARLGAQVLRRYQQLRSR